MAAHDGTQTAFAGYTLAVRLLPLLAFRGLERARRESRLSEWGTVTSDAVASALAVHQAGDAIVFLEQGRGILWSQQLENSADLAGLEASAPELAARLRDVRSALEGPPERRQSHYERR